MLCTPNPCGSSGDQASTSPRGRLQSHSPGGCRGPSGLPPRNPAGALTAGRGLAPQRATGGQNFQGFLSVSSANPSHFLLLRLAWAWRMFLGCSKLAFPLAAVLVGGRGVVGIWTKWALGGGPMKESGCMRGQGDLNWNSAHPTHSSSVVSSTKFLHRSFSCERSHNSRN